MDTYGRQNTCTRVRQSACDLTGSNAKLKTSITRPSRGHREPFRRLNLAALVLWGLLVRTDFFRALSVTWLGRGRLLAAGLTARSSAIKSGFWQLDSNTT